jgi:hypothetical protein
MTRKPAAVKASAMEAATAVKPAAAAAVARRGHGSGRRETDGQRSGTCR